MRPTRTSAIILGLALVVGSLVGCSEELGPEVFPTTRIEGTVKVGNAPVQAGFVEFYPRSGTIGNLRVAQIKPDGSFVADRVPIGKVSVSVANLDIKIIPTEFGSIRSEQFWGISSPIERTLPAITSSRLDLDLSLEGATFLRNRINQR